MTKYNSLNFECNSESIYMDNDISKYSKQAPSQKRKDFFDDLEIQVIKHSRYLHSLENINSANLSKKYFIVKRSMDIFVGIIGFILFFPAFLLIGLLIKLDSSGPIFFVQDRVGKKGRIFKMYKFRTMVKDAEGKTGSVWAVDNDPRTTYIGKFLRSSKLDELPQFINLIKGDMTLVGPRPERPVFVNKFVEYIPGYDRRLLIMPGITGLAQIRNGYDVDAANLIKKLRYEMTYMKKMNLSLDLRLLMETFIYFIKNKL